MYAFIRCRLLRIRTAQIVRGGLSRITKHLEAHQRHEINVHSLTRLLFSFVCSSSHLHSQLNNGYRSKGRRPPRGAQKLHEEGENPQPLQPTFDQVVQIPFSPNGLQILRNCLEAFAHEQD